MTEGAVLLAILVISLGDVTRSVVGQEFETDQSSQSQGPTECQAQAWVRNLSKHQRRYTCWAYTLREDPTDIEPYRNQLEYGEETPPPSMPHKERKATVQDLVRASPPRAGTVQKVELRAPVDS